MFRIIIAVIFLGATPLLAQYQHLKFENLSTEDGLSSSSCNEVFEDKDGFLWLGTIDGLNRYDGYEFKIYRLVLNDPYSISSNRINSITEDSQGRLWIGTANGLNVLDKGTEKFTRIFSNSAQENSISSNYIFDLFFKKEDNQLWVATPEGANKLDLAKADLSKPEKLKFRRYRNTIRNQQSIDKNEVTSFVQDRENVIWAVTSGQHLNKYNPIKDQFERIFIDKSNPFQLDHIPRQVLVDQDGDFWIGNNLHQLIYWNRKKKAFSLKSYVNKNVPIFDIYQDKTGLIWVATDGHGVYFIDKNQGVVDHLIHHPSDPFSLANNQPSRILEDKNGIIWVGNYNKGVSKLALSKSAFGHYFRQEGSSNTLSHKIAQSVIQDKAGRIWIGTDGGGLNLFEEKSKSFTHYRNKPDDPYSLSSDKITHMTESHDGGIWVCTWDGGLNKLNPATGKFTRFMHREGDSYSIGQNSVWCVVEDKQHRLWLGTQASGLNLFDPLSKRFYQYRNDPQDPKSLPNNFVLSLFIDSNNRLFVGTVTSLSVIDLNDLPSQYPERIAFQNLHEKLFQGFRVNNVTEDRNHTIWVGTDKGLIRLNPDLSLHTHYTTNEGLPNNLVVGVRADKSGNLWMTTKSGLSKLDPQQGNFKNFNIHDGIQGMEFQSKSIANTNDGRILIGGINGFNIFDPQKVLSDTGKLKLFLTDFKIYNKSVKANDTVNGRILMHKPLSRLAGLTLKYNEGYLTFDFLALNYDNAEKNQYAYKMTGLDPDWNYVGNKRSASYSNLGSGEYTFEVMASNDGLWNKNKIALKISVLPPPWKTWWAYLLYVLLFALALGSLMRYYARRVREEKERELDQMKLSFFINVSHEFRTPLTLILNPVDRILSSGNDPEMVKTAALTIQRSSRRLLNLVNQLLDFRKTDLGKAPLETIHADIVHFIKDLSLLFNDLADIKGLDFTIEATEKSLVMWFDPDKVEKIVTNLLSNAIKFTDRGGRVVLSVSKISRPQKTSLWNRLYPSQEKEYVAIKVTDSGIGLKKEQLQSVFERFFHVDNTKTGTGIGLHFTKSLVELHRGEISVESEYGQGSTFAVYLPLNDKRTRNELPKESRMAIDKINFDLNAIKAVEYELAIRGAAEPEDSLVEGNGSGAQKPVTLIVEDNKELRSHLKNELREHYRIREAVNGVDGLEKALKYYPDIIISDIMMPEMDGFELCRKIKTALETCHIPVVLLTARSLEEDKIEGYETGADEYLPKPFNIHVLKARLKNLLESRQVLKNKFVHSSGVIPKEVTTNNLDEAFLNKVTKVILENISNPDFSLEELLKEVGISRSHFFRKISSITGHNPSNFIRIVRLKYAAELLLKQEYSVKEISFMAGFNSAAYFGKTFKELFGKTPQQYMEEPKG